MKAGIWILRSSVKLGGHGDPSVIPELGKQKQQILLARLASEARLPEAASYGFSKRLASVSKVESNQERHIASTPTSTSVCRHMNAHSNTHCVHAHTCNYAHTCAHHIHTDAK